MAYVYVHGGVSGRNRDRDPDLTPAVAAGLSAGTALDMIVASVQVLEDDPALNAGFGSVLTSNGELELDAGIADGPTGSFGAVIGVTVEHPIALARRVLDDTPHVVLVGAGAEALDPRARRVEIAPAQLERWRTAKERGHLEPTRFGLPDAVDTVGAVALDDEGRVAAGSSTGGVFGKMPGRVGDSPICGAGTYASPEVAVVGTGIGELFIETLASARTARLVEDGMHPQEACEQVIAFIQKRQEAEAGLLALDADGRFGTAYRGASLPLAGPDGPIAPIHI
ncbi:MAG: isoaspartyl peptidase/L-asparaginase family protein [Actinomycetota bacterium]